MKVTDVVIVLTFERDETVGHNVAGRKMRLLAISFGDLEFVYENTLRKDDGKPPCLSTKTGSKWSKMRLRQLEELAKHVHCQPLSDHDFDTTRCFGVIRLYTPVTKSVSGLVSETLPCYRKHAPSPFDSGLALSATRGGGARALPLLAAARRHLRRACRSRMSSRQRVAIARARQTCEVGFL